MILPNSKLMMELIKVKLKEFFLRFVIFSLLLPFAHREGSIGQQARDALLLCMTLSGSNSAIAEYIAFQSNFCPVSLREEH